MRVTLVGTGISQGIPVVGCSCEACRSSDPHDKRLRTAAVVESHETRIAIDIGPDFRYQMLSNGFTKLDAVVITHEHSDHIAGLDDIRPFNWTCSGSIPFYAEERVISALTSRFPYPRETLSWCSRDFSNYNSTRSHALLHKESHH